MCTNKDAEAANSGLVLANGPGGHGSGRISARAPWAALGALKPLTGSFEGDHRSLWF